MKKPEIKDYPIKKFKYLSDLKKYTDHLESVNADLVEALDGLLKSIRPEDVRIDIKTPCVGSKKIPSDKSICDAVRALKKAKHD